MPNLLGIMAGLGIVIGCLIALLDSYSGSSHKKERCGYRRIVQ
jgi:hypothetical protein